MAAESDLPPLPYLLGLLAAGQEERIREYATAARAPLLEHIGELEAKIARLKEQLEAAFQIANSRTQDRDTLRAELEAMKGACVPTPEDAERQQWKGMDGAIAFHLIERHADSWDEAARMMHAWRDANASEELERCRADAAIEFEPGRTLSLRDLLTRAVNGVRVKRGGMLWPRVAEVFCLGSSYAHHLCRWAGRDPDTGKQIPARAAHSAGQQTGEPVTDFNLYTSPMGEDRTPEESSVVDSAPRAEGGE